LAGRFAGQIDGFFVPAPRSLGTTPVGRKETGRGDGSIFGRDEVRDQDRAGLAILKGSVPPAMQAGIYRQKHNKTLESLWKPHNENRYYCWSCLGRSCYGKHSARSYYCCSTSRPEVWQPGLFGYIMESIFGDKVPFFTPI